MNKLLTLLSATALLGSAAGAHRAHATPAHAVKNIVLVHGAFADGSGWSAVSAILTKDGYHVSIVQPPETSLDDDIAATKRVLDAQDGPVVLVGHSYGGAIITGAGSDAKVKSLVYVAAFQPDTGESIASLGGGKPPAGAPLNALARRVPVHRSRRVPRRLCRRLARIGGELHGALAGRPVGEGGDRAGHGACLEGQAHLRHRRHARPLDKSGPGALDVQAVARRGDRVAIQSRGLHVSSRRGCGTDRKGCAVAMLAEEGVFRHALRPSVQKTLAMPRAINVSPVRSSASRWRKTQALAVVLIATTASASALAQAVTNGAGATSGRQIGQPGASAVVQALDVPPVERLFGDWDGKENALWQAGVNIQVDALTEFAGNVTGGTKQGATFANQVGFAADVNWERLAHLTGLSTHLIIINRSGSSDSALFGDHLSPVQEIYGSGGDVGLHLVSAYAEETLFDKRFDVEIGRMNVENDFASSPLYCNFVNNGLCGDPKALPGGDRGHSAYPDAAWGTRVKVRPLLDVYVEAGLYEVNQGLYGYANFRSGFKFDDLQDSGVYLPAELGWEPKLGPDNLTGHYKLGIGYDTSGGYAEFGNALATAGIAGYTVRTQRGNVQLWALADQMLLRNGPGENNGVTALAGFAHSDPKVSAYAQQYYAGVVDHGFWAARPQDSAGLLFLYYTISGHLNHAQSVEQEVDLPLSDTATGQQTNEIILEAEYSVHLYRGLTFKPDFQYVIRPNAQSNIHNAAVLGFQAHVAF